MKSENKLKNSIKEYLKTSPEVRKRDTGFVKFNRKDRTITPIKRKIPTNKD